MHTRDPSSIPGSRRSLGEGNGNSIQYSCLENSTNRGAWRAIVHGVAKSQTPLSMHTRTHTHTHTRVCVCVWVFWAQHLESCVSNCHYYDKDKGNARCYETAQLEDLILSMGWKMSHSKLCFKLISENWIDSNQNWREPEHAKSLTQEGEHSNLEQKEVPSSYSNM